MSKIKYFIKKAHGALCEIILVPVKLYRKYFSSLKPQPTCRFRPTCSAYAIDAVREWGIIVGVFLALIRVVRCNPFSEGGDDPVPTKKDVLLRIKNKIGRQ
ncbi:MAG: membrane protein insertion efficiency factor YidD [Ruminococcaceae bacterium]|nr:membrane protein insertion efficiency factor YidD [Oscillospiraceae bacterium]